jgi:inner membrane protein
MEPVTHLLTGAVLARAGFNRKAAYATAAMTIAAELPDCDIVSSLWGPVAGFQHHRGITHALIALPAEAALVTLAFLLFHRLRKQPRTKAPPHWGWLFAGTLVALLSHLLLDWTNNYGIRPFFEPVMFVLLLAALVLPSLFRLINSEVGARRKAFAGRGWAIAGLVGVAALYALRLNEHDKAIRAARENFAGDRFFASPYPIDPFRWAVVADRADSYQLLSLNSRTGEADPPSPDDTIFKPEASPAIEAAKRSRLGRVYLDWSSYPVISQAMDRSDPMHPLTAVTFADARFFYDVSFFHGRPANGRTVPLSGTVLVDPSGEVVETRMGDRVQR